MQTLSDTVYSCLASAGDRPTMSGYIAHAGEQASIPWPYPTDPQRVLASQVYKIVSNALGRAQTLLHWYEVTGATYHSVPLPVRVLHKTPNSIHGRYQTCFYAEPGRPLHPLSPTSMFRSLSSDLQTAFEALFRSDSLTAFLVLDDHIEPMLRRLWHTIVPLSERVHMFNEANMEAPVQRKRGVRKGRTQEDQRNEIQMHWYGAMMQATGFIRMGPMVPRREEANGNESGGLGQEMRIRDEDQG